MSELKRGSVEAFLSNRIFLLLSFSASYTTTRTFLTDLNFLGSLIVNSLFNHAQPDADVSAIHEIALAELKV